MEIVVLTGSPHKQGTSFVLAQEFIKGAEAKKHKIYRFDAAFKKIHPCIGCYKCNRGDNDCIFRDDMFELYPMLVKADLIVYITPLFYHTYTAQLKAVIDRFFAKDKLLCGADKKAMLIVTGENPNSWVTNGIVNTYKTTLKYLKWQDAGKLLAINCKTKDDLKNTDFMQQAYRMGYQLEQT